MSDEKYREILREIHALLLSGANEDVVRAEILDLIRKAMRGQDE